MNTTPDPDRETLTTELLAKAVDYYATHDTTLADVENSGPGCAMQGPGFVIMGCLGKEALERYLRRFLEVAAKYPATEREEFIKRILAMPRPLPMSYNPQQLLALSVYQGE